MALMRDSRKMKPPITLAAFVIALLSALPSPWASSTVMGQDKPTDPALKQATLGNTKNVHSFGENLLCGQPSAEEFADAKKRGIRVVISLREKGEIDWDEAAVVEKLGLQFHSLGFRSPESLTDDIFDQSLKLLAASEESPVMMHCASANRVGAIWLAHRVLNDGIELQAARDEAKTVGLRSEGHEAKAIDYVTRKEQSGKPGSIKPGINDRFLDPTLDISEWLGRFEIESREVFASRERVLSACRIAPGMTVADIGAGTGLYTSLFASAVGQDGWVAAVDISPRFLEHINQKATQNGIENLTCVLGSDRSVRLPPQSIDLVFICDTYHHFEFPQDTLASIHRALKPDGTLVVIDFERIQGESRDFIMGHVRAGKEVFRKEIEDAGFTLEEEIEIPTFKENYMLRFRKQ